jgi:hypothetical protein
MSISMERPEPFGPDRQHQALQRLGGVGGRPSLGVEGVAGRDRLAALERAADLAAGGDRRRHVEQEGGVSFPGGRAGRERAGAEQRRAGAPRGHRARGIAEHEGDHPGLQGLEHVARRHAEMGAVLHRHDADAASLRHRNRFGHRPHAGEEAEAVLGVEQRRGRRDPLGREHGPRIDQPGAHPLEVDRQPHHAVGVDAAQVCLHQAFGNDPGIILRHVMRAQQPLRESAHRLGRRIGEIGGFGCLVHAPSVLR